MTALECHPAAMDMVCGTLRNPSEPWNHGIWRPEKQTSNTFSTLFPTISSHLHREFACAGSGHSGHGCRSAGP